MDRIFFTQPLNPPIGMLYLVLITSLRIHKTKIHVRNSNRRRFPLKRQNLIALFPIFPKFKNILGEGGDQGICGLFPLFGTFFDLDSLT